MRPPFGTALVVGLVACLGCADAEYNEKSVVTSTAARGGGKVLGQPGSPTESFQQQSKTDAPAGAAVPPDVARKIIYNADISLVTEKFDAAVRGVARLVKENSGYLADSNVSGSPGSQRSAHWKVRVPVERFDSFLDAVASLGELERRQTGSQDVSEEFYDLQARIKNKKVEEDRLVALLKEATGKLKEILEVEKEISRVREEVERIQGRLNVISNLTSLTTVTVTITERMKFIPAEAPGFATEVSRTFHKSVDGLVDFGKAVVLFVVAVAPWLPLILLAGGVVWLIQRRVRRHVRPAVIEIRS